jgi:RNA polymerase sigma-70 factor (ECF subfamily)
VKAPEVWDFIRGKWAGMELGELLKRCKAGDELAWEALVRQFQARIYSLAYHYAGNPEDARDLAQETFIRVYRNLPLCQDASLFVPWLIRITRNLCVDFLRRKAARPPASDLPADELLDLADHSATPEEQGISANRKNLLQRALQQLTSLNREIIILKEIQGMALEQISALLKVPLGTIKSRSNRARLELAEKVLALSASPRGREDG